MVAISVTIAGDWNHTVGGYEIRVFAKELPETEYIAPFLVSPLVILSTGKERILDHVVFGFPALSVNAHVTTAIVIGFPPVAVAVNVRVGNSPQVNSVIIPLVIVTSSPDEQLIMLDSLNVSVTDTESSPLRVVPFAGSLVSTAVGGIVSLSIIFVTKDHVTKVNHESITLPLNVTNQSIRELASIFVRYPVSHPTPV